MQHREDPGVGGSAPALAHLRPARLAWIAIALAVAPIVVAATRAAFGDWLPMGDNAYFTVRSGDVLGPYHPLLGAWSSGSQSVGASINNLGPLQLDLLAPFTRIGPAAGTAIGVAMVNMGSVIGVGLVVRRLTPTAALVVALAATAAVTWAMGSELLIEPRQHHAMILPFLCFVVLCWGLAAGDRWLLPWAAFAASLLVQTHFSYLFIVPILALWGAAALVAATRGHSQADGDDHRSGRPSWRSLRLPTVVTVGVLLVVWAQTFIDQVAGSGNLGRLLDAGSGSDGMPPGLGAGARIVGSVVANPSAWPRKGFADFDPAPSASGAATPALGLVLVAAVLGVAAWWGRRCRDRTTAAAALTALVALGAGLLAVARTPTGDLGPVAGNYRWLWPVTAFAVFALFLAATSARRSTPAVRSGAPRRPIGVVVAGALLVALTIVNLPRSYDLPITALDRDRRSVAVELLGQLEDADITGPVLFDRSRGAFTEPYSFLVLGVLQERGIDFTFDDDSLDVRRFGTERADRGRAQRRLVLVTGLGARETPEAAERVAFASSLTAADLRERATLTAQVFDDLVSGVLVLTPSGRRRADEGAYPALATARAGGEVTPDDTRTELLAMAAGDELTGPVDRLQTVRRLVELYDREIFETVALFLEPSS